MEVKKTTHPNTRVVLITAVSDILQILQEDQKTSPFR